MRRLPRPRCPKCGKAKFSSKQEALDLIARKSRSAGLKNVPIRAYQAHGTWHVSSKPDKWAEK